MVGLRETRFAYGEALLEAGELYPSIAVLDADLYNSTRTVMFRDAYPGRFIDVGIAEADMVSMAAGMAASGLVPFCNSFAIFLTGRCYDQIRIQIAYPKLHVVLAGSSAGLTQGPDGASHQSLEDVALMRALPNMTVLVPCDAVETRAMTLAAAELEGPCYIRLGRYPVPDLLEKDHQFRLGHGTILRHGGHVSMIACGHMVNIALEAARLLSGYQLEVTVINMSTIKPLDRTLAIEAAGTTPLVVTVEEHSIIGGLGSAVAEVMAESACRARLVRIGTTDVFGESGLAAELLEKYGLTPQAIADRVLQEISAG